MTDIQAAIDQISRQSGYGRRQQAHTNALYGINHRGIGSMIPVNTDNQGITFFTRPRLNLTYHNLAADRTLSTLMANNGNVETLQRYVRAVLDPISAGKEESNDLLTARQPIDTVKSNLCDNNLAFIGMLTNHLTSLSGWPDVSVDTFTSHEGINKEAWSMVDGQAKIYTTFDLTATFRNVAGDPISLLFNSWIKYASNVYLGRMMPYPDALFQNEIDYMTRIYRFILDPSRQYISKVASVGVAFPYAFSIGGSFDYNSDKPYITGNQQEISVPFRCIGCEYMDPITLREFNIAVQVFNPKMNGQMLANGMVKLNPAEAVFHNYYGYPYANEQTFELEWWVDPADYTAFNIPQTLGVATKAPATNTAAGGIFSVLSGNGTVQATPGSIQTTWNTPNQTLTPPTTQWTPPVLNTNNVEPDTGSTT
jgi:hypothetical protein